MINDSRTNNNNHFVQGINNQSFEINDLKVQLQDKTLVINELKHRYESEPYHGSLRNMPVHRDYLNVTKEQVATLRDLLEDVRALKPLDEHISHASKFAERIQDSVLEFFDLWKLDSPLDIVVEGLMLNVQNEGSICKFHFGYAVTDVEGYGVIMLMWTSIIQDKNRLQRNHNAMVAP
ncbi:hypothetical protein Tco_0045373 [Tanacetum coccineum]